MSIEELLADLEVESFTSGDDRTRCMWCCPTGGGGKVRYEE